MIETLSTYWQFLKHPSLLKQSQNKKMLWQDMLWLFLLDIVFASLIVFAGYTLQKFKLIRQYESVDIFKHGFAWALLLGIILAPLSEEFLFRWQLRNPKYSTWFVAISSVIIATSSTKSDFAKFFIIIGFIVAAIVISSIVGNLKRHKSIVLFRAYYVFLFYYTAIVFGYIHISNIKGLTMTDPSFILYIGSQIFGGLSLGYIRIKYGLKYSILLHACINAFILPIAWLVT
ncbi:hypothetical protein ACVWYN_003343 [Pedobacter sp. UYP24]